MIAEHIWNAIIANAGDETFTKPDDFDADLFNYFD